MQWLLSWQFWLIGLFVGSATYVNVRGRRRYGLRKQITDHSSLTAPVNAFIYLFSAVPNRPFLDRSAFPELDTLKENWTSIRDEAVALAEKGLIKAPDQHNDLGFNSFFRKGWTRFYLKWYDDAHPSAREHAPVTVGLLRDIPTIKAAMFALLPAGGRLRLHRDPYAGSVRYHLGLVTPDSDACFIQVDDQKYSWRDGEDVVFDETFLHEAYNRTGKDRIILFCDVRRPMRNRIATWFNDLFARRVMSATASPNLGSDRTGMLNRVYQYFYYRIAMQAKRFKDWNDPLFHVFKYGLIALILYLLLF